MRQEVRLATADTVRGDAGNWTCRAQVFQNGTIEVGDAVEYSVQLVVVGECICVFVYLFTFKQRCGTYSN